MKITLKQIRDKSPCASRWKRLIQSLSEGTEETTIAHLLKNNGVDDSLWVLFNCVTGLIDKKRQMLTEFATLALEEAEKVLPIYEKRFPNDSRIRDALTQTREAIKNGDESAAELVESAAAEEEAWFREWLAVEFAAAEEEAWFRAWLAVEFAAAAAGSAAKSAAELVESAKRAWFYARFVANEAARAAGSAARAAWFAADLKAREARETRETLELSRAAEKSMRSKQSKIILKYFGE